MSDQLINMFSGLQNYVPFVSFIAGLGGSLHCVGMCGGLVTASCHKRHDVFRYQIGRLMGYLLLGSLAGTLGGLLKTNSLPPMVSLIPALLMGSLFVYWGIMSFRGKKSEKKGPKFLSKLYSSLWKKGALKSSAFSRPVFIGFISILLPCGLLYGVALGTLALQSGTLGLVSMFFFWLGTVPAMVVAPAVFQKFLLPLKSKLPKVHALGLVTIGLFTIALRAGAIHQHEVKGSTPSGTAAAKVYKCH